MSCFPAARSARRCTRATARPSPSRRPTSSSTRATSAPRSTAPLRRSPAVPRELRGLRIGRRRSSGPHRATSPSSSTPRRSPSPRSPSASPAPTTGIFPAEIAPSPKAASTAVKAGEEQPQLHPGRRPRRLTPAPGASVRGAASRPRRRVSERGPVGEHYALRDFGARECVERRRADALAGVEFGGEVKFALLGLIREICGHLR